jgi:hypothetical protein
VSLGRAKVIRTKLALEDLGSLRKNATSVLKNATSVLKVVSPAERLRVEIDEASGWHIGAS